MARPIKNNRRDKQLNFSLTAEELQTLQRRADAAGQRLVDYGRHTLLNSRRMIPQPAGGERFLSKVERLSHIQLRRLGNNLNQLVYWHHRHRRPFPHLLEPLLQEIRDLIRGSGP